ncbi:erythrocyte membrane protein 1 var IT-ICAM, partial [Plasmodium falciparum IGH-CR14]
MAPQKPTAPDYNNVNNAKDLFDEVGKYIEKKVRGDAQQYFSELHGRLSEATFEGNKISGSPPCDLDYTKLTNVTTGFGKEYPCENRSNIRFSDVRGGECADSKIKGNKGSYGGACAPLRRLHLCDYNLENISDFDNINNHTLLVDVCLAAKHEGELLKGYHDIYKETNRGSQLCTVLARSFADIGDIIRGRDLYLGNKKEKDRLEENLKKIFQYIKNKNKSTLESLTDEEIREYWWALNRQDVWKAITCEAGNDSQYFRQTCVGGSPTQGKCLCADTDVPTYFDYVPQYLRWFEEWAEDFCRKKNKKLKDVKTNCREQDKYGNERYCDLNGFDCERTIYKKGYFVIDKDCNTCSVWCRMYESWIDNQKKEFLKQKEKYTKEITSGGASGVPSGNGMTKGGAGGISTKVYDGYEKKFYEELKKGDYGTVDKFLNLLSKEKECENIKDTEGGGKIHFNNTDNKDNKTFYHSEYCEECPECGVKREGNRWENKQDGPECTVESTFNPLNPKDITKINVLYSGKGRGDITEKLKDFCEKPHKEDGEKNEQWECYYKDVTEDKCRMKKAGANDQGHDKIMSFNDFFNFWVGHVLNDSIEWRKQLTKCLSEDKLKKCEEGCKSNCECFKKWIEKKEKEWEKIKEHFKKQEGIPGGWTHYNLLETILEYYYFKNIQKAYGDLKSIQEMKKMIEENKENKNRTKGDVDALDVLFDHELEEAEDCLDIHEDDDECVEESEQIPNNPCSGESGGSGSSSVLRRYPAVATKVAYEMHKAAKTQLRNRAGGRKTLRADASKGHYSRGGSGDDFKDICKITKNYTNDSRSAPNGEPCTGKDKPGVRFEIGTEWSNIEGKKQTSYKDVFLPPRREHMCTSNLENLDVGSVTKEDKASHSLLGDVLLAANKQAEDIKKKYQENKRSSGQNEKNAKNGLTDKKTVCRAMKYSFADIGDIIKGTDLWDQNSGEKTTQGNLVKIFEEIKGTLTDDIQKKYKKPDGKHKQLRADWWTANRRQVWRAMKCATKNGNIQCGATPYDDYIPQRLRWMTEWAEWFCKMQSQEYDELMGKCGICMNGRCTGVSGTCKKCEKACKDYKKKIEPWENQWNEISGKYLMLYLETQIAAANGGTHTYSGAVEPKDEPVVDFLQELQKEIKNSDSKRPKRSAPGVTALTPNTPYETADRYIHQEIGNVGCNIQNEFCFKKNGDTSSTATNNEKYAFMQPPKGYEEACGCKSRPKPPEKKEDKKDACEIVEGILNGKSATSAIDGCNIKSDVNWECEKNIDPKYTGACMPPRRQKLCIHYLVDSGEKKKIKEPDNLKDAFIKCAAVETFLSWQKYKEDKKKEKQIVEGVDILLDDEEEEDNLQNELNKGIIPEDFKRKMFYTFGDYRDLCLGKDIGNDSGKDISGTVTSILSTKNGETQTTADDWWKTIEKEVWDGMVCALSYSTDDKKEIQGVRDKLTGSKINYNYNSIKTNLKKFVKKPQFLRWMIEWGEEFCVERKKKEDNINDACSGNYTGDACNDAEHRCNKACKAYEDYVNKKKGEFQGQTNRFVQNASDSKAHEEYEGYGYKAGEKIKQGNEYLLEKCDKRKCDCMDGDVGAVLPTDKPFGKYAFPKVKICNCLGGTHAPSAPPPAAQQPQPEAPQAPPTPPLPTVDACGIVAKIFEDTTTLQEACPTKYVNGREKFPNWKCVSSGEKTTTTGSSGAICIPPRRRRLYVGKLHDWASDETTKRSKSLETSDQKTPSGEKLRTAFIESAAVETFFAWHEYKEEKKREEKEQNEQNLGYKSSILENLQKQLKEGKIPEDFLRQMFYTFGDYRDIVVHGGSNTNGDTKDGGDSSNNDNIVVLASGTKEEKDKMEAIQKKIDEILEKSGNENSVKTVQSSRTAGPHPGISPSQNSVNDRQSLWETYAEPIWNGMVCALTYKEDTSGEKDKPPEVDPKVKSALFKDGKKPTDNYTYDKVELKEDKNSGARTTGDTSSPSGSNDPINNPKLSDFVKLPPFFRWLHEWGSDFCGKRARMLKNVKKACREKDNGDDTFCSGDGHDCTENGKLKHKNMFADPDCPGCYEECRKYRKWIDMKFEEFYKQKSIYQAEHGKLNGNSNGDNKEFCQQIKEKKTAADFLAALKHCKDGQNSGEKGIRKEQWKCKFNKEENTNVCKLDKFDQKVDLNEYTTFKVLLIYWLEDFIEGYYILKKRKLIEQCTQKGENTCDENSKKNCACVKKWVEKKTTEWEKIKDNFKHRKPDDGDTVVSKVRNFLQELIPRIAPTNDKGK